MFMILIEFFRKMAFASFPLNIEKLGMKGLATISLIGKVWRKCKGVNLASFFLEQLKIIETFNDGDILLTLLCAIVPDSKKGFTWSAFLSEFLSYLRFVHLSIALVAGKNRWYGCGCQCEQFGLISILALFSRDKIFFVSKRREIIIKCHRWTFFLEHLLPFFLLPLSLQSVINMEVVYRQILLAMMSPWGHTYFNMLVSGLCSAT